MGLGTLRCDTPSEPTAKEPSGPAPERHPVTTSLWSRFVPYCGYSTPPTEPVAPTHISSSPVPEHVVPPEPASAMSNTLPATSDNWRGLFNPFVSTTGEELSS